MNPLVLRVAARFQRLADQAPGGRNRARQLTTPINKPKGIDRQVTRDFARTEDDRDDQVSPDRRDIRPSDVFTPTPNNTSVLSLAQSSKDLSKAIDKQIPKDKGYDVVRNLSQYLIRTEGNGEGGAEGKP